MDPKNWKILRKNLALALLLGALSAAFLMAYAAGLTAGLVVVGTVLCLALGFWLTEGLVGVMTKVKTANSTAIGLLFIGKLGWWLGIFWFSRNYPAGSENAIAVGLGVFLLSILITGIGHFGWPKLSDAKGPGEP